MVDIETSIEAIQNYNPREGLYLKVIGSGSEQHLEAIRINWFGRLLMWLGFTTACMTKVAQFVEKHLQAICKAGQIDLRDPKNPLRQLVNRILIYNDTHKNKLDRTANNIVDIYNTCSKPIPTFSKPIPVQKPSPPKSTLDKYHEIKGQDDKGVKELLNTCCKDLPNFEALIKAMSLDEVTRFATNPEDVFCLLEEDRFLPSACLTNAITYMSVHQLQRLISSLSTLQKAPKFLDAFYNVAETIRSLRSVAVQEILFNEMIAFDFYRSTLLPATMASSLWESAVETPQLIIDRTLVEHGILKLSKNWDDSHVSFFDELITSQTDIYGGPIPLSCLQNREFLNKLSAKEQDRIGLHLLKLNLADAFILITDIMLPDHDRSKMLYAYMSTRSDFKDFCLKMRTALPHSDEGYINYLLQNPKSNNQQDQYNLLKHFMEHNLPDLTGSVLECPKFIKGLRKGDLAFLAWAIFASLDFNEWENNPIIKKVMENGVLVEKLFMYSYAFNPNFDSLLILDYCYIHTIDPPLTKLSNYVTYNLATSWASRSAKLTRK